MYYDTIERAKEGTDYIYFLPGTTIKLAVNNYDQTVTIVDDEQIEMPYEIFRKLIGLANIIDRDFNLEEFETIE